MERELSYDLHIHSCLSPCGDDDMTPGNIVGMAAIKGLDVIAVTDHNSCRNCPAVLKLAEQYGGASLYIPKVEALVKALRDKRIQKEYNGYNAKELAQKYELSVNWVLNICKDNPLPEQQSLF